MRILDRSKLVPYLLEELPAEVEASLVANTALKFAQFNAAFSPSSDEFRLGVARACDRARRGRADSAWLLANLPAGTVFDHLGATVMVIRHEFHEEKPGFGRKELCAVLDMAAPEGTVAQVVRSVAELRAMLEPDFAVDPRGRNC